VVLLVRPNVPESPRWLFIHGRESLEDIAPPLTATDSTGQGAARAHAA
jgi:hypothetical protein